MCSVAFMHAPRDFPPDETFRSNAPEKPSRDFLPRRVLEVAAPNQTRCAGAGLAAIRLIDVEAGLDLSHGAAALAVGSRADGAASLRRREEHRSIQRIACPQGRQGVVAHRAGLQAR